jgi:cell division transport system permease protein
MVSRRNSSNRLREAPATQLPRERRAVSARLQAWFEHHRGSFRSSLRRLRDRAWSSILTVLVMGIALALPFLLHVLLDNARSLSGGLQEAREITVFLKSGEDDVTARAYASELEARSDVTSVTVRTPAEGLAEFRHALGFRRSPRRARRQSAAGHAGDQAA